LGGVRGFIFTDRERGLLREWLQGGVETGETRKVFTAMRRNIPKLRGDLELMLEVTRELKRRKRWGRRVTRGTGFGSSLRRAESALTRLRRGGATSGASRS